MTSNTLNNIGNNLFLSLSILTLVSCSVLNYPSQKPLLKLQKIETISKLSYYHILLKNNSSDDIFLKNVSLYNLKNDFESLEYIPNKLTYPDFLRKGKSDKVLIVLDSQITCFDIYIKTRKGNIIELTVER